MVAGAAFLAICLFVASAIDVMHLTPIEIVICVVLAVACFEVGAHVERT